MSERFSEEFLELNWKEWFLGIQGFFYFAQGVAFVAIIVLPLYMQRVFGISDTDALGYYGTIMIPWAAKLVYGILSDNVAFGRLGRRKPYIVIAGALGLVGWITLPFIKSFGAGFIVIGLILSLSVALSDATLDSLAVDITPQKRRGAMQAIGWGMRGAGMALSGYIMGLLMHISAWKAVYILPGAIIVLSCFVVLLFPEPKISEDKIIPTDFKMYKESFSKSSTWWVSLFMILSGTGITVVAVFTTFVDKVTSLDMLYVGLGVTAFALGQFVGAIVIGLLGDHLPLFPILASTTVVYGGLIATMYYMRTSGKAVIFLIVIIVGAINGGYEATQMRIGMEHSVGPIGGTMYNWFMSLSNLGQLTLGAWFISGLAEGGLFGSLPLSYPSAMQFATVFLVLALIPGYIAIKKIRKKNQPAK